MTIKKNNNIFRTYLSLFVIVSCLGIALSTQTGSNYLVLKNDKVFALGLEFDSSVQHSQQQNINTMWISNDQQSIKIEVPVQVHSNKQQTTANHSQHLPIFYSLLTTKGYLKPITPFTHQNDRSQFVKGYKYAKPAYHDSTVYETYEQIQAFVKAIVQSNNLNYLNLRMEDTFEIEVVFNPQSSTYKVNSITIKYLFATLSKDSIPQETLNLLSSNTQNYDKFLAGKKVGTIQRKLSGRGLHQWVNHTVTLDDITDIELQSLRQQCFFEFTDILPESTYIDADQRRDETTNYEVIDIEKPSFASKQFFYKYRVPITELKESGVRKYSYAQPVHFRYPSPSLLNYTKVYLHPIEDARIVCEEQNQESKALEQIIYPIEQNLLFERGTASLPNADSSKSKIVSITTLVVCLVTALVIIKNLKKN